MSGFVSLGGGGIVGSGANDAVRLWDGVNNSNRTDLFNDTANVSYGECTIATWVRLIDNGVTATNQIFTNGQNWAGESGRIAFYLGRNTVIPSGDRTIVLLLNNGSSNYFAATSSSFSYPLDTWFWLGLSYSVGSGRIRIYINNTLVASFTGSNVASPISLSGFQLGASSGSPLEFYDYWLNNGYVDFDIEANRRKFITAGNTPVNLGNNGQLVNGTSPQLYFGGLSSNWLSNKGALSGANLTARTPANFGKASTKPM
jgi:hypothetical protein